MSDGAMSDEATITAGDGAEAATPEGHERELLARGEAQAARVRRTVAGYAALPDDLPVLHDRTIAALEAKVAIRDAGVVIRGLRDRAPVAGRARAALDALLDEARAAYEAVCLDIVTRGPGIPDMGARRAARAARAADEYGPTEHERAYLDGAPGAAIVTAAEDGLFYAITRDPADPARYRATVQPAAQAAPARPTIGLRGTVSFPADGGEPVWETGA